MFYYILKNLQKEEYKHKKEKTQKKALEGSRDKSHSRLSIFSNNNHITHVGNIVLTHQRDVKSDPIQNQVIPKVHFLD